MNTLNVTYDFDRDCPGNPSRIPGCRCINHRPDLYLNTTGTLTGATLCTAPPSPPVYPVTVWPPR